MPLGVDIAVAVNATQWACLAAASVQWVAVRAWHSYGAFDNSSIANLAHAHAVGLTNADVYMFPCPQQSPETQASGLLTALQNAGAKFGKVWIDVEPNPSHGCAWDKGSGASCVFLRALVASFQQAGVQQVGFYSNLADWRDTVGLTCSLEGEYSLPLWYAHYDHDASTCSDFAPFGGWTSPYAKQFTDRAGTDAIARCGVKVDTSNVCATAALQVRR